MIAIFTYVTTISSALLSTTARVGALQTAYRSANFGAGAAVDADPVDAILFHLLFLNGLTDMDLAFTLYMKNHPYPGNFTGAATTTPSDTVIYRNIVLSLQQRLQKSMSEWESFQEVLGNGSTWTGPVQEAGAFVADNKGFEKCWAPFDPLVSTAVSHSLKQVLFA
ncbi:MAG: hypothetical protein Q9196_003096 [Gyalolechia fulgens]